MGVKESRVERHLIERVESAGGMTFKLIGYKGIADRLVILPGIPMFFVELKAAEGRESEAQMFIATRMKMLGMNTYCLNSKELIDQLLDNYTKEVHNG